MLRILLGETVDKTSRRKVCNQISHFEYFKVQKSSKDYVWIRMEIQPVFLENEKQFTWIIRLLIVTFEVLPEAIGENLSVSRQ